MRAIAAGLTVMLAAGAAQAAATAETAGALAGQCRAVTRPNAAEPVQATQCLAYIIGVFDAMRSLNASVRDPIFCPPETLKDGQFAAAFLAWAEHNGSRLGEYPVAPVIDALLQAFACPRR